MISIVIGARPNVPKAAPIVRALNARGIKSRLIATGQHRTDAMFGQHMRDLEMPEPDMWLGADLARAGQTHAGQTAAVMVGVEADLKHRPDWLVVLGDVDSTLGAALAAAKLGIRIAHVEAGYRSNDWTMPEEVNRVLVDRMSDLLFCPDEETRATFAFNGLHEACKPLARIRTVGNVMMDSLRWALEKVKDRTAEVPPGIGGQPYAVLTVHRPSNVDSNEDLLRSFRIAGEVGARLGLPIIWPAHPRVRQDCGLSNCTRIDPLGYLDMVALLRDCSHVITDSGGLLEEALMLNKSVTCLRDPKKNERQHLLDGGVPEAWKTDAAPRIVDALMEAT